MLKYFKRSKSHSFDENITKKQKKSKRLSLFRMTISSLSNNESLILNKFNYIQKETVTNLKFPTEEGEKAFELKRNRYSNILPFDYNRVVLKDLIDEYASDYINASKIKINNDHYIATQGPTKSTIVTFWQMIYQNSVKSATILMLTPLEEDGVKKCSKYWCNSNIDQHIFLDGKDYGFAHSLELVCEGISDDFEGIEGLNYTKLQLNQLDSDDSGKVLDSRIVHHFYYTKWSDFEKPGDWVTIQRITQIISKFNKKKENSPLVVHCSAGVGRTGTYISLDQLLNKDVTNIDHEDKDPIFETVLSLRSQRIFMVQSASQYKFLYETMKAFESLKDSTNPGFESLEK